MRCGFAPGWLSTPRFPHGTSARLWCSDRRASPSPGNCPFFAVATEWIWTGSSFRALRQFGEASSPLSGLSMQLSLSRSAVRRALESATRHRVRSCAFNSSMLLRSVSTDISERGCRQQRSVGLKIPVDRRTCDPVRAVIAGTDFHATDILQISAEPPSGGFMRTWSDHGGFLTPQFAAPGNRP